MGADSNSKTRLPSHPNIPREDLVADERLDPTLQAALNHANRRWQWEFDQLRASMSIPPPKPPLNGGRPSESLKPPSLAPKAHWMAHVAGALTSFAAVLAVVVALVKAMADLRTIPPTMATKQELADMDKRCLARSQALSQNALNFRNQVLGVWELQGVKTQDPPGAPPRRPVGILPPPAVTQTRRGSSKLPAAPMIQIDEPIATPPRFDVP